VESTLEGRVVMTGENERMKFGGDERGEFKAK
jgi:hypothetical protein